MEYISTYLLLFNSSWYFIGHEFCIYFIQIIPNTFIFVVILKLFS